MTKQALMGGLKQLDTPSQKVSTVEAGLKLGLRIKEAIGEESISSFGRRCEVGESTLRKYIAGASPNTQNLIAMADTANVNIEWLAAGRGPKLRGVSAHIPMIPPAPPIAPTVFHVDDIKRLAMAMEAVEKGLGNDYFNYTPAKRAQITAAAYDLLIDMDQKDNIVKFIKMAA